MTWKTKRNIGNIFIMDEISDGPGMRNTRSFLKDFFDSFVNISAEYYEVTEEYPFTYKERQTHSVIFPAIFNSSDAAFVEKPVSRKVKRKSSSGRLDYWVAYGDSVFIIECKHSWQSIKSDKIRDDSQKKWKKALEQIASIKGNEAKDLAWDTGSLVKIVLHVIPTFCGADKEQNLIFPPKKSSFDIFSDVMNQLSPRPNYGCLWTIHRNIVEIAQLRNDNWESYPTLMIFALAKGVKIN